MTPIQIDLVQSSFKKVAPLGSEAGRIFYGRLFNIAPEVRPLFRGDLDEQAHKLVTMLAAVVGGLKDLDAVLPAARDLAVRHVDYGVAPEHYKPVGEALIWTLNEGLGEDFDDATREAWVAAYGALSDEMITAAYSGGPN